MTISKNESKRIRVNEKAKNERGDCRNLAVLVKDNIHEWFDAASLQIKLFQWTAFHDRNQDLRYKKTSYDYRTTAKIYKLLYNQP